jgi:hypothetical protein
VTVHTFEIVLDVHVDGDEISGHARDADGLHKPFLGWLGLIAALDGLLDCSQPREPQPAARVSVAFSDADDARAFASSDRLQAAILEARTGDTPQVWYPQAQQEGDDG